MSRILSVEEVAKMLRCEPETVREKTPGVLPGVKFGRDWVYAESVIIRIVEQLSTKAVKPSRKKRDAPAIPTKPSSRALPLPQLTGQV